MTDVAKLGLDVDSTSVKKAADDLDKLDAAGKRVSPTATKVKDDFTKLDESAKKTGSTVNRVEKEFADMERTLKRFGLAIGISIAAFVSGSALLVRSIIMQTAALDDMAEKTGASVESLSALQNVAKVSGVPFDTIVTSMGKLSQTLSIVDDESKAAAVALGSIGLEVNAIKAMSPDQQMLTIAKALDKYADSGSKSAIIQALYKRGAQELLPFLKDLANTGELVTTVTTEQAAEAERLEKAYNRVTLGIREFFGAGIRDLSGILTEIADAMTLNVTKADELVVGFNPLKETFRALAVLATNLSFTFRGVGAEIGGILAQIQMLIAMGSSLDSQGKPITAEATNEKWRMFKEISKMMKEDAEKARADFEAVQARLMGISTIPTSGPNFMGPPDLRTKPKADYNANSGKQTDSEKRLEAILAGTDSGLKKALEDDIKLVNEWGDANEDRTLQAVQAVNMLEDAYDKASGAFDAREKKRKEAEKAAEEAEKDRISMLDQALDADIKAGEQISKNTEEWMKQRDQVERFKKTTADRITDLQQEAKLVGKTAQEREFAIEALRLENEYQEARKGLSESELAVLEAIYEKQKAILAGAIGQKNTVKKIEEDQKKQAEQSTKIWDNFVEHVQNTLGDQLYNVMQGNFKNIGTAFYQMLQKMLADALAANIMGALTKGGPGGGGGMDIFGSLMKIFAPSGPTDVAPAYGAKGAYFSGGDAYFAKGGVVSSPTSFKFASGGVMRNGVMGEAGDEAIMPLKRDSAGRLGVSGGKTIQLTYAPVIQIDSRTDREEIHRDVSRMIDNGHNQLVDKLQRARVL